MHLKKIDQNIFHNRLSWVCFFSLIFIFYFWTASQGFFRFAFTKEAGIGEYHQYLADAFLHGQLDLLIKPSAELLSLPDPYDPAMNSGKRLHDASLYQGKYFLYFTPIVAVLFIIPIKLIFGYFIPATLLAPCLCFVGFLFSFLILRRLLQLGCVEVELSTMMIAAVALATATMVPFLLRRIAVYEVCIAAAYAFLMIGSYLLISALVPHRKKNVFRCFFASTFLGLCVFARPNQCAASGMLILVFLFARYYLFHEQIKRLILYVLTLVGPMIIIGIIMCWYNYARFESIFEFGTSYQLAATHLRQIVLMSPVYIPLGIYNYLFQPVFFNLVFPYFHAGVFPVIKSPFPWPYAYEPLIGIMRLPVYWCMFIPLFCIHYLHKKSPTLVLLATGLGVAGLFSLLSVSILAGVTMRYLVDFSPMILLAVISLFLLSRDLVFNSSPEGFIIRRLSFSLPVFISALIAFATSLTGYYNNLFMSNPKLYIKIKERLSFDIYGQQAIHSDWVCAVEGVGQSAQGLVMMKEKMRIKVTVPTQFLGKKIRMSFNTISHAGDTKNISVGIDNHFLGLWHLKESNIFQVDIPETLNKQPVLNIDFYRDLRKSQNSSLLLKVLFTAFNTGTPSIGFISLKIFDPLHPQISDVYQFNQIKYCNDKEGYGLLKWFPLIPNEQYKK